MLSSQIHLPHSMEIVIHRLSRCWQIQTISNFPKHYRTKHSSRTSTARCDVHDIFPPVASHTLTTVASSRCIAVSWTQHTHVSVANSGLIIILTATCVGKRQRMHTTSLTSIQIHKHCYTSIDVIDIQTFYRRVSNTCLANKYSGTMAKN